ncbi:hypothetical protein PGQ11_010974 [Apiospora arundinis]|uniref:Uncharacterized protein n=1 Tax=Apiospora arundinis TaxID=335852 RepID=A0ABR2HZ61_9PEZI
MKLLSPQSVIPFLPGVASINYAGVEGWGNLTDIVGQNAEYEALLQKGLSDPTASRSVKIYPFVNSWPALAGDSTLRDSEWTWRVNTSDIAVPKPDGQFEKNIQDPHVVAVSYDFSWSKGTNISDALGGSKGTLCTMALDAVDLPVSVLNKYTEENAKGDCAPILGEECVKSLLSSTEGAIRVLPGTRGRVDKCDKPSKSWRDIPSCQESIGKLKASGSQSLTGTPLGGRNSQNQTRSGSWLSGDMFFGNFSSAVNGSRSDTYLASVNQLHMLMLNARLPFGSQGQLQVAGPSLFCTRVNATKLPDKNVDKNGGVAMLSGNIRGSNSGGEKLGYSVAVLMITASVALVNAVV